MFAGLGRLISRRRWTCAALLMLVTVAAGAWGLGVFAAFSSANSFATPGSQSTRVAQLSVSYFGSTNPDLLVLYTDQTRTVDDPTYMRDVLTTVARVPKADVKQIQSYWSTGLAGMVSRDRHSTVVFFKIAGTAQDQVKHYLGPANDPKHPLLEQQLAAPGLQAKFAGNVPLGEEFATQMMADIVHAESISFVPLLLLLLVIFGSFTAAWLPLLVGGFSVIGGLAVLRVFTLVTPISVYASEVVTMLGLGLAIDYSLFIITRFREELAQGRDRQTALVNTMRTAGRTVAFSGITVATALGGLLFFPQMFLRSIGLGGISVVVVAVVGANVVLPTLLALLGKRIEFGQMPWRKRKARRLAEQRAAGIPINTETGFWYKLGRLVMKRPLPFLLLTMGILIALFLPFTHVQFGTVDVRVLPKDSSTRQVTEYVKANFPGGSTETIDVVVSGDIIPPNWRPDPTKKDDKPAILEDFRKRLEKLPHVTDAEYTGYDTSYGGIRISVTQSQDPMSVSAQRLVATIRAMKINAPPGQSVYIDVGGSTAGQMDEMASISHTLPAMAGFVGLTTFILLFLAFGSVLLPIKAVLMNVLSIGASFGAIVWGFQWGHLAGVLDFTPTGTVEATTMILILAMVFGLSMDYEVFLLSRIREEWDRTHDNRSAVAHGMQKTGGIISSAAVLILVVIAAFSMAGITVVKLLGVGMFVAVIVDASLVRSLLVPATMRYLGRANWWLPGPLAKLHGKFDLREVHDLPVEVSTGYGGADLFPSTAPAELRPAPRPSRRRRFPDAPAAAPGPVVPEARNARGSFAAPAPAAAEQRPAFVWRTPPGGRGPARIERPDSSELINNQDNTPGVTGPNREIMPNSDGTGWNWRTSEGEDANGFR